MKPHNLKRTLNRMFSIPPIPAAVVSVYVFVMFLFAVTGNIKNPYLEGITCVMAAYAAIIVGRYAWKGLRRLTKKIRGAGLATKVREHPLYEKYAKDMVSRLKLFLLGGAVMSLLYAGVKVVFGVYYHSSWLIILSVYYALLAVIRASLLAFVKNRVGSSRNCTMEWKKYRQSGILLLIMNQVLVGIVVFVVVQNRHFEYPGALIYVMALYSFYAVIFYVFNAVKVRKLSDPLLSAARVVSLTAALVSMLSLETAMLARFGGAGDAVFSRVLLSITGGCVCAIVLGMAVYMIVKATRKLKKPMRRKRKGTQYDERRSFG